jgi:16S rRNA (cytidine1402-2'-O)-methyltransferase
MAATLYIVSTPIGNLGDITLRALEVLKAVDVVAAEDTRHSRKLFSKFGIKTPLVSYFGAKEELKCKEVMKLLASGKDVALISDAGTPGISDPGFNLIREVIREGYGLISVPGPSAVISALTVSGLPTVRFAFEGFLPPKGGARKKRLESLADEERTLVIYESPRRTLKTLRELAQTLGDRPAILARELTKLHEELVRGTLSDIIEKVEETGVKGEVVLVLAGCGEKTRKESIDMESVLQDIAGKGLSLKDSAEMASSILDMPKRAVYQELLRMKSEGEKKC